MQPFPVEDKRVVVIGAGRSGVAAARLLAGRGARVLLTDLRSEIDDAAALRAAGVELELGAHRVETLTRADLIVLSPGVPADQPAVQAARRARVPVTGELELASRLLRGRIIAITGTKGKSTTTTLTGRILGAAGLKVLVGGNIGEALSRHVDDSTPDTLHVVEVSSFQLETIETFHPWIAVFLNFSPDHLDRHASVEEYGAAKAQIFRNQTGSDWAVINADDPEVLRLAAHARARRLPFGLSAGIHRGIVVAGKAIVHRTAEGDVPLIPLAAVKLPGRHLLADVLAAAAVGTLVGASPAAMTRAVESFSGLEHALETVGELRTVRFVNDSKATNVAAARRSLESFDREVVAIMGGRFKGGDLADLRAPLRDRARAVVAIGDAAPLVEAAFADLVPVERAATMGAAVRAAFRLARPGGTVLLAPACASFDMFRDYAERGRVFKQEVASLAEEVGRRREQ